MTAKFEVHEIVQEIRIAASRARVWRALVDDTSAWWHRDFYVGPEPHRFVLEASVGGRMGELCPDGQGLSWGTVIAVRTEEMLQASGVLDAAFGGPANVLMTWKLAERDGGTSLQFRQTTWGAASAATNASLDVGWRFLLDHCLREWVEHGRRVTDPAPQ